jgi:hypothetical protein
MLVLISDLLAIKKRFKQNLEPEPSRLWKLKQKTLPHRRSSHRQHPRRVELSGGYLVRAKQKKDSGAPSGPESSALVLPLAIKGGKIDGDG